MSNPVTPSSSECRIYEGIHPEKGHKEFHISYWEQHPKGWEFSRQAASTPRTRETALKVAKALGGKNTLIVFTKK